MLGGWLLLLRLVRQEAVGRIQTPGPPPPPPPSSLTSGGTTRRPSRANSAVRKAFMSARFLCSGREPAGEAARQLALDLGMAAQQVEELAAAGEFAGDGHALAGQFIVQSVEPLKAVFEPALEAVGESEVEVCHAEAGL